MADRETELPPDPPRRGALAPGTILNGIYRIEQQLGAGGMGEVYRATNIANDEQDAIKVIGRALAEQPMVEALFRKEARVVASIHSPAVARLKLFARDPALDVLYFVTEFIPGHSLLHRLQRGPATPGELRALLRRVATGLMAVHEAGAVHRDLSPDNIILPGGDVAQAKLIDFGIVKELDPSRTTVIGYGFAGKFGYIAPEQLGFTGARIGPWTDLYGMALTALAFARGGQLELGNNLGTAEEARRRPFDLSAVAGDLRPLFERLLVYDWQNRLQSGAEVLAMLGHGDAATVVAPPPPSPSAGWTAPPWADSAPPAVPLWQRPLRADTLIGGRYRVVEEMDDGGLGESYRAVDIATEAACAIRLVRAPIPERSLPMFREEAWVAASIRSPAVARLERFEQDPSLGVHYYVSEPVDGVTLRARLAQGPAAAAEVFAMTRRLATGLQAIHAAGATHRCLSPGTVMLPRGDVAAAKLTDVGGVKGFEAAPDGEAFEEYPWVGVRDFTPPEQLAGPATAVGPWTDLYALGLTVIAFAAGTTRPPGAMPDALPAALRPLFERLLAFDPGARPPSAAAVLAMLDEAEAQHRPFAPTAPPPVVEGRFGTAPDPARGSRSRPLMIGVALLVVCALLAIGAVAFKAWKRPDASIVHATTGPTKAAAASGGGAAVTPAARTIGGSPSSAGTVATADDPDGGFRLGQPAGLSSAVGAGATAGVPQPGALPSPKPTPTTAWNGACAAVAAEGYNFYFAPGAATLGVGDGGLLDRIAASRRRCPQAVVRISGYGDAGEQNALSRQRAVAVRAGLIAHGVASGKASIAGAARRADYNGRVRVTLGRP